MRRVAGIESGGTHSGFGQGKKEHKKQEIKPPDAKIISLAERRAAAERATDQIEALRDKIQADVIDLPNKEEKKPGVIKASDLLSKRNRRLRA